MLPPPLVPAAPADPTVPLRIVGLAKRYGDTTALAGLGLEVPAASCFGIVGPNGSGKTTTLRTIVGLVRPDAGRVEVHGVDAMADVVSTRRLVGAVLDPLALFERLTARELLVTLGELRGLDADTLRSRAEALFGVLDLTDDADRQIAGYSHGMRKKTALAAALVHRPRLLLLDEPFEGVDPVSARTMRSLLDRFRAGGGTVVLSSHAMDLVERLCDHLAVLHGGRVVLAGRTDELRGERRLEDTFVDLIGTLDVDRAQIGAVHDGALTWLG
ncbi:MAG: ABC transporter ATP-binding protein [Ilumatobacteraceae bacterium]